MHTIQSLEGTLYYSFNLHPGPCSIVWECGEGQTDTQTSTQTAVTNIHFALDTLHAKCRLTTGLADVVYRAR